MHSFVSQCRIALRLVNAVIVGALCQCFAPVSVSTVFINLHLICDGLLTIAVLLCYSITLVIWTMRLRQIHK